MASNDYGTAMYFRDRLLEALTYAVTHDGVADMAEITTGQKIAMRIWEAVFNKGSAVSRKYWIEFAVGAMRRMDERWAKRPLFCGGIAGYDAMVAEHHRDIILMAGEGLKGEAG